MRFLLMRYFMSSQPIPFRPSLFRAPLAVSFLFLVPIFSPVPARAQECARQQLSNAKLRLFVHYVFGLTQAASGQPPMQNVNAFAGALDVNGIALSLSFNSVLPQFCCRLGRKNSRMHQIT
jgi:hypothetical protein